MENANVYSEILDVVDEASFTSYLFMCDLTTGKARISNAAANYLGLKSTVVEDFKECFLFLLDSSDAVAVSREWDSVVSHKKDAMYLECRLRNGEGEYDSCILKGRLIGNKDVFAGTIIVNSVEGIFDSITELYTFSEFLNTIRNAKKMNDKFVTLLVDL